MRAATEREEVLSQLGVLDPAFGTESKGVGEDCGISVQEVEGLGYGGSRRDGVGAVGEGRVGDAGMTGGDGVGSAEAFVYYGLLRPVSEVSKGRQSNRWRVEVDLRGKAAPRALAAKR